MSRMRVCEVEVCWQMSEDVAGSGQIGLLRNCSIGGGSDVADLSFIFRC